MARKKSLLSILLGSDKRRKRRKPMGLLGFTCSVLGSTWGLFEGLMAGQKQNEKANRRRGVMKGLGGK